MSKLPSSGLKAPSSKVAKSSGLPTRSGLPTPVSSRAQSALEKSARAAGVSAKVAESYATQLLQQQPGPELDQTSTSSGPLDDFIIGDRVYVGGTKPGHIAFIGETQFAPGEWAGIVLDEPVGKNDGAVAGIRYFQCEARKGVFARLTKITREPVASGASAGANDSAASATPPPTATGNDPKTKTTANGGSVLPASVSSKPGIKTAMGLPRKSLSGSTTNVNKSASRAGSVADLTSSSDTSAGSGGRHFHIAPGDRVLVSGSKAGVLRYVGETDFAKGDWAGVELDEPLGKNDGAVAGKRYFSCKPLHGLFAPVHKVTKTAGGGGGGGGGGSPGLLSPAGGGGGPAGMVTPSPRRGSVPKYGLGMSLSRDRSGSQDSISSIGSSASSVSRSREELGKVRIGTNAIEEQQMEAVVNHIHRIQGAATPQNAKSSSGRPTTLNLSATNTALQKALKEKEEHIEQLLRERDMERSELARAASQVDEAESMLAALKADHQRYVEDSDQQLRRLRETLQQAEQEKNALVNALEEEKRKVEDMQFTIEEEAINKGDLESQNATEMAKLTTIEDDLKNEKARCEKLEKDLAMWKQCHTEEKARFKDAEETSIAYLDQIEELTHKLSVAENQLKSMENAKAEQGSKVNEATEALQAKSEQINQIQELLQQSQQNAKNLQERVAELEEELQDSTSRREKHQETIDDLMKKLATSDTNANSLTNEVQVLKTQLADLQRQLTAQEEKTTTLEDDKNKLEEQIAELLANSGDSSQQLTLMSEQLREKERRIEELQAALSDSTQKVGKLSEEVETQRREAERQTETLLIKHQEDLSAGQERLDEKQTELEKAQAKISKLKESHEEEKSEFTQRFETETQALKSQLEDRNKELESERTAATEAKDQIQQLMADQEKSKFEREKIERQLKKADMDAAALKAERDALAAEKDRLVTDHQVALTSAGAEQNRLEKLLAEKEELFKAKTKMEEEQQATLEQSAKHTAELETQVEAARKEQEETAAALAEASVKLTALEEASLRVEQLYLSGLGEDKDKQLKLLEEELERLRKEDLAQRHSLSTEIDKLRQEKQAAEEQSRGRYEQLERLEEQLKKARQETLALTSQIEANKQDRETLERLEKELSTSQQKCSDFEGRLKVIEMEREALKVQVSKLKAVQQEKVLLESSMALLKAEVETIKQREKKKDDDHSIELTAMKNSLDMTQLLLSQRERDVDKLQNELKVLEGENALLTSRATSMSELEKEKEQLQQKVSALERASVESRVNANLLTSAKPESVNTTSGDADPELAQLREEKEAADGQIDFLNSVIVDMQRKNEELTIRLQAMESGEVRNGTNHDDDDNYISNAPRKPAPRLFCDICDMFDLHDTDDCPTQAMSDSPTPTSYHSDRHQERPYCNICEVFGHWTDDCDDEQTF